MGDYIVPIALLIILVISWEKMVEWFEDTFDFSEPKVPKYAPPVKRWRPSAPALLQPQDDKIRIADLPVNLPILSSFPPPVEEDKDEYHMGKKVLCRKCDYLVRGNCIRGIADAPRATFCAIYLHKNSPEARRLRKERDGIEATARADTPPAQSCGGDNEIGSVVAANDTSTPRHEILLSSIKD